MKKITKILAMFLAVMLVFAAFAACGSDADKDDDKKDETTTQKPETNKPAGSENEPKNDDAILGNWSGIIDMAPALAESGIEVDGSAKYTRNYTFNADGTYTSSADKDEVMPFLRPALETYFGQLAEAYGMTLEDLLAQFGYDSFDALLDEEGDSLNEEGTYKYEDGKLFFADEEGNISDDSYIDVKIDGDELVFEKSYGSAEEGIPNSCLPVTFTRSK